MREQKVWMHYLGDILAADLRSAVMLASFLKRNATDFGYVRVFEVIDVPRFKIHKDPFRIHTALRKRKDNPFVFVACKN